MILLLGADINNKVILSIHVHPLSPMWVREWAESNKEQEGVIIQTLLCDIYDGAYFTNQQVFIVNIQNSLLIHSFVNMYKASQAILKPNPRVEAMENDYISQGLFDLVAATVGGFSGEFVRITSSEHLEDIHLALKDMNPVKDKILLAKQEDISDVKTVLSEKDYNNVLHPPGKILVSEFQSEHSKKLSFFKKPFSQMRNQLKSGSVQHIDDVKKYANKKPGSVTAKVLREFSALRYKEQKKYITQSLSEMFQKESTPIEIVEEYLGFKKNKLEHENEKDRGDEKYHQFFHKIKADEELNQDTSDKSFACCVQ